MAKLKFRQQRLAARKEAATLKRQINLAKRRAKQRARAARSVRNAGEHENNRYHNLCQKIARERKAEFARRYKAEAPTNTGGTKLTFGLTSDMPRDNHNYACDYKSMTDVMATPDPGDDFAAGKRWWCMISAVLDGTVIE